MNEKRFFDIKYGGSRTVILIGNYAIKIPNGIIGSHYKWLDRICEGWFNNRWELDMVLSFGKEPYNVPICPLVASVLGGFLLVFRRCDDISRNEFDVIKWWTFSDFFLKLTELKNDDFNHCGMRDKFSYDYHHRHNVGKYKGQIVAVDLGYPRKMFSY